LKNFGRSFLCYAREAIFAQIIGPFDGRILWLPLWQSGCVLTQRCREKLGRVTATIDVRVTLQMQHLRHE
jgi:hypothetical protein